MDRNLVVIFCFILTTFLALFLLPPDESALDELGFCFRKRRSELLYCFIGALNSSVGICKVLLLLFLVCDWVLCAVSAYFILFSLSF